MASSSSLNNKLNRIQKDKQKAIKDKERQDAIDKAKKLKQQKQRRTTKNIVEYNATKTNTHLISGYLRKIDIEESNAIKLQRQRFRVFVNVLKSGKILFKGIEDGSKEYFTKLDSARKAFNQKHPNQFIESIDVLKNGYGKNKGITSQQKGQSVFESIIAVILRYFESFFVADQFDKFCSNLSLQTDGNTLRRSTKDVRHWYTGFGTEIVRNGEMRSWKISLANYRLNGFTAYIGICDVMKCHQRMEGPVSDLNNGQFALSLKNGNKCHQSLNGHAYARKCKKNEVVEMILNMKGKKKGSLRYIISGKDYGIAFDNIDKKKCFKLAISTNKKETFELLS